MAELGILGAGTMGAGIARLAGEHGVATRLHDTDAAALERALGRLPEAAAAHVRPAAALDDLAGCDVVIEAVPEDLDLKRALLGRVAAVVGDGCVLATNTSSLPVTAIAAGVPRPQRVVGLHFFNPPHRMRLVELVAGDETEEAALERAARLARALGREVIRAADTIGFVVNRVNRPFVLEAQKLVAERVASVEQLDRIARLGGGFRMGPFELQDLIGLDTNLSIQRSFWEQSFGESRWRPSPLTARMVAAGRLGRKAGRGWYAWGEDGRAQRPVDPPAPPGPDATAGQGRLVVIAGDLAIAHELRILADDAGWDVREPQDAEGEVPELILDCGAQPDEHPLQGGPQALLLADGSLAQLDPGGASVGFHALPPLAPGGVVELTRSRDSAGRAAQAAEAFFHSLGLRTEWVADAPGLVLGRIVCQLVNEAAFAVGEGVASPEDVDTGMVLGLNHPRGPLRWGDEIGLDHVLAVLDALHDELREERYRAAPLLRRLVAEGRTGVLAGEGFHRHE
ncbi:MAG: 3-hydroxybutyryl-CoA dehydrogenase [Solirubrobacteraceae bacterium]|nr:3-hydroxybutyryl-CoA dehydrogenase [Solirubrobacteraceae bacterium]